jgi:PAS domain S-box-containing protein
MADEDANMGPRADVTAKIKAALAEPALASLARAGAPLVLAVGDPPRAVHANRAAFTLFGARDCDALTERLFGRRTTFAGFSAFLQSGAPTRLERIETGALGGLTFLCRRTGGESPLFVFALLGSRGRASIKGVAPVIEPEALADGGNGAGQASLASLRLRLAEHYPDLAPARFLWRTDARGVVVQLTPPLAEIVGPGCADLVGRNLLEALDALGLDPRGELANAMRARVTFSHVELDWPIERACAAAPVTLGALPVFDPGAEFEGWRGFGVIHLDRLREAPLVEAPFRRDEPASAKESAAAPQPQPTVTGVVVPLRPVALPRPAPVEPPEKVEPRGRVDVDDDAALVSLSPHERSAFREIARALGARIPGGVAESEPSAAEAGAAEVKPATGRFEGELALAFACQLAEAVPLGLAVIGDDRPLFVNRLLLDWLGFADLAAFEQAGGLKAVCRHGLAAIAPGQKRTLLMRASAGEAFSVDAHCQSLPWGGARALLYAFARPSVSALEQRIGVQEASLRQRETEIDEFQSMLATAADGVVLINADGEILGLDRGAEALLDYDRNQVSGENFTLLLAADSRIAALEHFTRAKAGAERQGREALGRRRNGGAVPVHLTIGRLGKEIDGKYCLILRDLSHRKQTEQAMEDARARAERDSQAKSEFLAKVSHEIRTPLNAILGFAEVIMDERFGPIGNGRYKDYLRDIHASGSHVMSLVNDLLDLSKIEAGKQELDFAAVDANRVVSECVSLIQPQANRERVITRLALAPRLPPILADERSLRQIALNLLANAVRYNEPGGQVIVSTALDEAGQVVLRVKDTGVGMSESELRTAMEPFRQVAPARGGTGLGLPLTKALAEANHAAFSIKSRKNEGTLVEVVFPLAPGAAEIVSAGGKNR